MSRDSEIVRRGDAELLEALGEGETLKTAAERAGVSYATAKRRWADPGFQRMLRDAAAQSLSIVVVRLAGKVQGSVDVIGELHDQEQAAKPGAGVRLRAAQATLGAYRDLVTALGEMDLAERVAELERQLGVRRVA